MVSVSRFQLPSFGLLFVGVGIAVQGVLNYVDHLIQPNYGPGMWFLVEFVFVGHLLVGGVLIWAAAIGVRSDRPLLPTALFVGVVALIGTVAFDVYSLSDTGFVVALGLLPSVLLGIVAWDLFRRSDRWSRPETEDSPDVR